MYKKASISLWGIVFLGLALIQPLSLSAQSIPLTNPSFEDRPAHSRPPQGWFFCGDLVISPPDINPNKAFGVIAPAQQGHTYLGLVTRADSTYEAVGQQLATPLLAGRCYRLGVYVRRSLVMQSVVTYPSFRQGYLTAPCRLRVRGANQRCEESKILAISSPVYASDWQYVELIFQPKTDHAFLLLEAYYASAELTYGNLQLDQLALQLLDDCSEYEPPTENALPYPEQEYHFLRPIGHLIQRKKKGSGLETSSLPNARGKSVEVNSGLWQLAQLLKEQPKLKLLVGLRASSRFRFREAKRSWRKAWRPLGNVVVKNRIAFIRIQDTSDFSRWTYRADAAPYWLSLE